MTTILSAAKVQKAAKTIGNKVPKGGRRYKALKAKLLELYGINNSFTHDALEYFEWWTGERVRGEYASGSLLPN